jgi:predicted nucleic acid-binding protein
LKARRVAERDGTTVKALVEAGLRRVIDDREQRGKFRLRRASFKGRGLQPGARISGPQVHDARVAALCIQHGVRELWTADRDFSRFAGLTTVNPLIRC